MKTRSILELAIILILVGVAGMAVALVASSAPPAAPAGTPSATLGRQIYETGADSSGPIPRTVPGAGLMGIGMYSNASCADCHGLDGRGGRISMMFGTIDIPDIRYSTLTTARSENGTTTPAWTDAQITRAIQDGVDPSGQLLKSPMPRWAMSDADVNAVIAYLKELSKP
jgi:mono/diheme cytochrome c family protein